LETSVAENGAESYTPPIADEADGAKPKRQASEIAFPYIGLNEACLVAKTFHEKGTFAAEPEQLAAWLGHENARGGAFRTRVAAARIFGLVETSHKTIEITELGRRICDPVSEKQARAEAFLKVPLFDAVYQQHKGFTLPADVGLEQYMVSIGVPDKQKTNARQVFRRSAEQAGFFEHGKNRLVLPVAPTHAAPSSAPVPSGDGAPALPVRSERVTNTTDGTGTLHFAIDIRVGMSEIGGWSPERISSFFTGIAKALAANKGTDEHGNPI